MSFAVVFWRTAMTHSLLFLINESLLFEIISETADFLWFIQTLLCNGLYVPAEGAYVSRTTYLQWFPQLVDRRSNRKIHTLCAQL